MFCEHCGKQLVDPDLYCEHCGSPLPEDAVKHGGTDFLKAVGYLAWSWVKRYKVVLICIFLLVTLVTGGFMVVDYLKTVIDPADYVTIHLSGYDNGGVAECRFNEDYNLTYRLLGLGPAEMEALDTAYETEETKLAALLYMAAMAEEKSNMDDIFTMQVSSTGNNGKLANGDKVHVNISVNQDILETYGLHTFKKHYEVIYEIGTDTPKLPQPTFVDLFSHVEVSIEGPEGYGKLYIRTPEAPIPMEEPVDGVHSFRIEYNDGGGWGDAYLNFDLLDENGERVKTQSAVIMADGRKPASIGNLVNGDTIAISAANTENMEACGIFLTATETAITAENLRGMEEIDLLSVLEYEFCGPEGYGYIQFLPGTYKIPVAFSADGRKELSVDVVQDPNYDFYNEYSWIPPAVLTFTVNPAENEESQIRITAYPDPYNELKNGDTVTFLIDDWRSGSFEEALKEAGYTIKPERTETVTGLLAPVELKLSEILDYTVWQDEYGEWNLEIGTAKTTELPENDLGIQKIVTTLREEGEGAASKYIVTFAFTTTDAEGKAEEHSVDCEIYITLDKYYKTVKFELIREQYRDLWKYGLTIVKTYEQISVGEEA